MFLNEWYNEVDYDAIETISWQRHLEEDYDEDDEGNPISMMLYNIEMTDSDGNTSYFDNPFYSSLMAESSILVSLTLMVFFIGFGTFLSLSLKTI